MSRAALVDAAFNALPDMPVPELSLADAAQLIAQAGAPARKQLVDEAIALLTSMVRSQREKGGGDCFFSALSMATKSLTGRHYSIAQLRQVLADILTADDLIEGWEEYRTSEVNDLESKAYYNRQRMIASGTHDDAIVQQVYNTEMAQPRRLRAMTQNEYVQYVKTAEHWGNMHTLLIFSAYFDVQIVPLREPAPGTLTVIPVQRGSNADSYIFMWYDPDIVHFDLFVSANTPRDQEVTVFTKDTMETENYVNVTNILRTIAVQSVLKSKLPAAE